MARIASALQNVKASDRVGQNTSKASGRKLLGTNEPNQTCVDDELGAAAAGNSRILYMIIYAGMPILLECQCETTPRQPKPWQVRIPSRPIESLLLITRYCSLGLTPKFECCMNVV